jgi:hypothetical protein
MNSQDVHRSSHSLVPRLAFPAIAAIGNVLLIGPAPVMAADWAFDPRVVLSGEYDDNDRMTNVPSQEIEVYGPKIDALLAISARTPTTTFILTPRFSSTQYFKGSEDDANNGYLRLLLDHKTQRTDAFLNADYSTVETLGRFYPSSDVTDPVLGNPDPGVSVPLVAIKNRQDRYRVAPGVSFDLTERQSIEVGAQYLDVTFDKDLPSYRPYDNWTVYGNYNLKTTNTATLSVLASYDQYQPRTGDNTNYWALNGQWANRWSETAEVFLRAGASFVEANQGGGTQNSGSSSGFSGGAGVRWAFQVTNIFLDANQYLDPHSNGDIVTRTQLRLEVARQLSQTTTLNLALRGIDDSAPPGNNSYQGQKYAAAEIGGRWRMARQWTLFGHYQYRWKKQQNADNSAQSNSVSIGVTWEPNRK